jgi:hypothetical protein
MVKRESALYRRGKAVGGEQREVGQDARGEVVGHHPSPVQEDGPLLGE